MDYFLNLSSSNEKSSRLAQNGNEIFHSKEGKYSVFNANNNHYLNWFTGMKDICNKFDDICLRLDSNWPHAMIKWENSTNDIQEIKKLICKDSDETNLKENLVFNRISPETWHITCNSGEDFPVQLNNTLENSSDNSNDSYMWDQLEDSNTKHYEISYEYLLNLPYKEHPDYTCPEDMKIKVPGVYWAKNSWIASWYHNKKRYYKSFSAKTHGFYKAKFWAIKVRLMQERKPSVKVKGKRTFL